MPRSSIRSGGIEKSDRIAGREVHALLAVGDLGTEEGFMQAIGLNCSLKRDGRESSTQRLLEEIGAEFEKREVRFEIAHARAFDILPGVTSDEGDGDQWPQLRARILGADILVMGTPIWLGQPSSISKLVLERMDAFLGETDDHGRMPSFNRVACVAVVGNEDGAHHVSAELYQALNDVGFTLAANAVTYWVGTAMGSTNYIDLEETPDVTREATALMVSNATHLARCLRDRAYPGT
jgi:multimeric flavodoxin WrbA